MSATFPPSESGTLRNHERRIRALEGLTQTATAAGPVWADVVDIEIWERSNHPAGNPTIDSFGGKYVNFPAPGTDDPQTMLTHIYWNVTLGALGSTIGNPWEFLFTIDPARSIQIMYGNGHLFHTEPSGSEIVYDLSFTPITSGEGMQAVVSGVEPDSGSVSGDSPGYLRDTYPCVIAAGDQFEGWIWGLTQESVD